MPNTIYIYIYIYIYINKPTVKWFQVLISYSINQLGQFNINISHLAVWFQIVYNNGPYLMIDQLYRSTDGILMVNIESELSLES